MSKRSHTKNIHIRPHKKQTHSNRQKTDTFDQTKTSQTHLIRQKTDTFDQTKTDIFDQTKQTHLIELQPTNSHVKNSATRYIHIARQLSDKWRYI